MSLKGTINICFSDSLKEVLNDFNKKLQVVSIPMIFDIGNLKELESLEIPKYLSYSDVNLIEIENSLKKINKIIEISTFENFVVWYSEDSNEYCGMLYFFYKMREKNDKNIYLINCSQKLYLNNSLVDIKNTSEIRKELIPLIKKEVKWISYADKQNYINEFELNFALSASVRIYVNDKIMTVTYLKLSELIYNNLEWGNSLDYNISLVVDRFSFSYNVVTYIIKRLLDNRNIKIENGVIISWKLIIKIKNLK